MNSSMPDDAKYLSLETFRKTGQGVRTPVWFAAGPDALYVYTTATSGKAKRIRRDGRVRIAPCDARGRVTGDWHNAKATIVGREEFVMGMRLLNRKYRPWKQILDLFVLTLRRHERIVLAIQPV